jgi:hypothetical protein
MTGARTVSPGAQTVSKNAVLGHICTGLEIIISLKIKYLGR